MEANLTVSETLSAPKTTSPTKRQAYTRLLDKRSHSKPALSSSRVSSLPLTPPKPSIRSSSSAPKIPFLSNLVKKQLPEPTETALHRVQTVKSVLDSLHTHEQWSFIEQIGNKTILSNGEIRDFEEFINILKRFEVQLEPKIMRKLDGMSVSLADSKKLTAGLRDELEVCISTLSTRFFQEVRGKVAPVPEAEMTIHAFLMLIALQDPGLQVQPGFKVMHHKTWKTFQGLASHPGKLIGTIKAIPQAIKHGKITSLLLHPIHTFLQPLPVPKITTDETAFPLFKFLQTVIEYTKSSEFEHQKESQSLQFLRLKDASPRRKLLTSLLNRSVEETRDEEPASFIQVKKMDVSLQEEKHKEELEEEKVVEGLGETQKQGQVKGKNKARPASMDISTRKIPSKPTKTPSKTAPKTTPKATPKLVNTKKRPNSSKPKVDPEPVKIDDSAEKLRLALLLDIKMRVFLQDKVLTSKSLPEPTDAASLQILLESFGKYIETAGESINPVDVTAYCSRQDVQTVTNLIESVKNRLDPGNNSWTHREIQRQKDRFTQTLTRFQTRKSLS